MRRLLGKVIIAIAVGISVLVVNIFLQIGISERIEVLKISLMYGIGFAIATFIFLFLKDMAKQITKGAKSDER